MPRKNAKNANRSIPYLEATAEVTGLEDSPLDDDATAVTGEPHRPELTGTDNS